MFLTSGDLYLYLNFITCLGSLALSLVERLMHIHLLEVCDKINIGMAPGLSDLVKLLDAIDVTFVR